MSTFDRTLHQNVPTNGNVPASIEEGVEPYRVTNAGSSSADGSVELDVSRSAPGLEKEAQLKKIDVFRETFKEHPKFRAIVPLLEGFIKRTRFLKLRRQPKEHFVRLQTCMVGFLFHTRVRKQRLGYGDIRELFVNLFDLYDYCLKGIPKSAALVLLRLTRKLLVIMGDLAAAIEIKSNQRATDWNSIADVCRSLGKKAVPYFSVGSIMPSTDSFTTVQILGQGGFGVVTKALFGGVIEVAVKMVPLDKQDQPKYAVVDKVTACLVNHPLVIKYHCTFRCSDAHVTVMEFVDAVDLLVVVTNFSKKQKVPLQVRQHIVGQMCLALAHLHFKGLIHRDVKPSNIMITKGCRIKLFDFDTVKIGMGKFSNRPLRNFYMRTSTEFIDRETAGTICFFPPEVLLKQRYGRCIDWWALGITLFEMAYGYLPFRSQERPLLKQMIKDGSYSFPKDQELVPSEVEFIERCLQKNPSIRLCSGTYSEFRTHEYLIETKWAEIETSTRVEWEGVDRLLQRRDKAKKEARSSKLAEMPHIEETFNDPGSPPLYTFTSASFLNTIEKLRLFQGEKADDSPELVPLDVQQRYRFTEYLL